MRFDKDLKEVKAGNGIEVLTNRKNELDKLKKQLKVCKNNFRRTCLIQEIERLEKEYKIIDEIL